MKRITLQISRNFVELVGFTALLRYVERMELQRIYRFDENTFWAIQKFKFFDSGFTPAKLIGIEGLGIKYLEELSKEDENTYICLVKTEKETKFHELLSDFNLLLDYPLIITQDYIEISLISDEKKLKSIIQQLPAYVSKANFKILNISDVKYENETISSLLTPKQLNIIQFAVENGFFEIPRMIKSTEIADEFNISASAFNELLRRVERKISTTFFRKQTNK